MSGVKLVRLIRRKQGLAPESFQAQWLNRHGMLARLAPGLAHCVQSHPLLQGYAKGPLLFDGVDEFWFASEEALAASLASPAWRAIEEDLSTFAAARVLMPVDVHVIKDQPIPAPAIKNIEFVNRRPGMALEPFRRYWRETHGPLAARIPSIVRYEQNHLAMRAYGGEPPPFDGLAITWFHSTADMRAGAGAPEYAATRADEANFLPDGHLPIIITREHTIMPQCAA